MSTIDDMSDPQLYRDIGALQANMKSVQEELSEFKEEVRSDMSSVNTKLDTLIAREAPADQRELWKVGGAGGGVGALIMGAVQWLADHWK